MGKRKAKKALSPARSKKKRPVKNSRAEGANSTVVHDERRQQFRLKLAANQYARILYRIQPDKTLDCWHTEVPPRYRGEGIGKRFVGEVIALANSKGLDLAFSCTFLVKYARENPLACQSISQIHS